MKKLLSLIMLGIVVCLCGCIGEVSYQTKFIGNCTSTEFRQEPVNDGTVIYTLNAGDAVSFERDVKNGFSKVAYEGVTGYVLSTCLVDEQPTASAPSTAKAESAPTKAPEKKKVQPPSSSADVEGYIANYIRPMYNDINNNINSYNKTTSGSVTDWSDGYGLVKREYQKGADGYDLARQYYYDSSKGKMIFAFMFDGNKEHRLYFDLDSNLIRYIDDSGRVHEGNMHDVAYHYAARAMEEAY